MDAGVEPKLAWGAARGVPLELGREGLAFRGASGPGEARLLVDGRALTQGSRIPRRARSIAVEGTRPGRIELDLAAASVTVRVLGLLTMDAAGEVVDLSRSHASIERTPPSEDVPFGKVGASPDALRYLLIGEGDDLPDALSFTSKDALGAKLDTLARVALDEAPCPKGTPAGLSCRVTPLMRAVVDDVDRSHPLVRNRSLRAEVGGSIGIGREGSDAPFREIRVGGPRSSPAGPIERFRGKLRVSIVREAPTGAVPFGGSDEEAIELGRKQVAWANAVWGQCGIHFGNPEETPIRVIDPPPPHLVAIGCDLGLPATGGEVRLFVEGREVRARLAPGMTPKVAARKIAHAIEAAGFVARISENVRIGPAASPTVDLLVRHRDGKLASVEPPRDGRASTDGALGVCIGEVDLSDGLDHFTDVDAAAGTVEERTLIKSLDDGDPATIEVIFIPAFARGGRIGESFIFADRSSIRNVVLEDRAGVRADRASFALAHELGHVLLDMPGHPDDFGVDTPTLLMDSDAADLSAFGPRRLTLDECARALRQSGPKAETPLLEPWPLQ